MKTEFLPLTVNGSKVYSGFGERFAAGLIDAFVILPLAFLLLWLQSFDRNLAILIAIPAATFYALYNVYL
ncbi:MAG: hypothetical protein L3J39_16070 [Verrucomicrobiales bacterium]|nr:hypothetical protein [Verrucomicrobiales bacterium]